LVSRIIRKNRKDHLPQSTSVETDPYGAAFLEDDECEDEDDSEAPVITRSIVLERLKIDLIINLAKPKLIARFNDHSSASISAKAPASKVLQKSSQKWSAASINWAASNN
jgi:hypothetical protein